MIALKERLLFREKYCFGKRKTLLKPKEGADQDLRFFAKEEQRRASQGNFNGELRVGLRWRVGDYSKVENGYHGR